MTPVSQEEALLIVNSLRQGSNLLDGVAHFSAGREPVFRAAEELLTELELSGGSAVRWIRGNYGAGKTHTFARVRQVAQSRNWVVSYVQVSGRGQGCELHRFEEIYAAIVMKCTPPRPPGERVPTHAQWQSILDDWVDATKRQAGARPGGDVPSMRVREALTASISTMRRNFGLGGSYSAALLAYANARLDDDIDRQELLLEWFGGINVFERDPSIRAQLKATGIQEVVSRRKSYALKVWK